MPTRLARFSMTPTHITHTFMFRSRIRMVSTRPYVVSSMVMALLVYAAVVSGDLASQSRRHIAVFNPGTTLDEHNSPVAGTLGLDRWSPYLFHADRMGKRLAAAHRAVSLALGSPDGQT